MKATHDGHCRNCFRKFYGKNVAINKKKCYFYVTSFESLGYFVYGNRFRTDLNRLSPLADSLSPKKLSELGSLLDALQYYSRFIPGFNQRASCLFNLVPQPSFEWSSSLIFHFSYSSDILRPLSPIVITNALPVRIGELVEQKGKSIICVSRRLSRAERGYS